MDSITYPCWDWRKSMLVKGALSGWLSYPVTSAQLQNKPFWNQTKSRNNSFMKGFQYGVVCHERNLKNIYCRGNISNKSIRWGIITNTYPIYLLPQHSTGYVCWLVSLLTTVVQGAFLMLHNRTRSHCCFHSPFWMASRPFPEAKMAPAPVTGNPPGMSYGMPGMVELQPIMVLFLAHPMRILPGKPVHGNVSGMGWETGVVYDLFSENGSSCLETVSENDLSPCPIFAHFTFDLKLRRNYIYIRNFCPLSNVCSQSPNFCSPSPTVCSSSPILCSPSPTFCSSSPILCSIYFKHIHHSGATFYEVKNSQLGIPCRKVLSIGNLTMSKPIWRYSSCIEGWVITKGSQVPAPLFAHFIFGLKNEGKFYLMHANYKASAKSHYNCQM